MSDGTNIFSQNDPTRLPEVGDDVSHFQILEQIGEGGMGRIYRAKDINLGREVALKFLVCNDPHSTTEDIRTWQKRFIREAKVMARVCHPSIVQIYEVVLDLHHPYFAMEYVPGINLFDRHYQKPALTYLNVTEIMVQVVSALRFAWEHFQIVHRDLKPENIMISETGTIKLLDMGLAKIMNPDTDSSQFSTRTGLAAGTPDYMAPEQHMAEPDLDHRVDIYALGCLLCQLYTFRLPFKENNLIKLIGAKMHGIQFQIENYAKSLPSPVIDMIYRMIITDRRERIDSYGEIEDTLRAAVTELASKTDAAKERSMLILDEDSTGPGPTVELPPVDKTVHMQLGHGVDFSQNTDDIETSKYEAVPGRPAKKPIQMLRPAEVESFRSGQVIGGYELDEVIGRGTFGVVYRAVRQADQKEVAVKFLELRDTDEQREHFSQVGAKLMALKQECICPIHAFEYAEPYYYLVSDFLKMPTGQAYNLHHYRVNYGGQDGFVAERQVVKVGFLILQALQAAHEQEIIHGNLKPTNILFECVGTQEGYLKLHMKVTDFGLIDMIGNDAFYKKLKAKNGGDSETTATLSETMLYLSPEQWNAQSASIASDLYSAGLLIFYFLTGRPTGKIGRNPSELRPGIHEAWDPILGKVLRGEPGRRFKSAEEFIDCLAAIDV